MGFSNQDTKETIQVTWSRSEGYEQPHWCDSQFHLILIYNKSS